MLCKMMALGKRSSAGIFSLLLLHVGKHWRSGTPGLAILAAGDEGGKGIVHQGLATWNLPS